MYAFYIIVKWDYKICLMNKLYYHFIIIYFRKTLEKIFPSDVYLFVFLALQPTVVVFSQPGSGL